MAIKLIRLAIDGDYAAMADVLREEGFIRDRIKLAPEQLESYLGPFLEPAREPEFTFSRAWMQRQFQRVNDPRGDAYATMLRLNLPPSYMLIHRTWSGGIGVLSQLEATVPFRQVLSDSLPGFAG